MAPERVRVVFHGSVQGVGFRYTTRRLAGGFEVTGWVRNLPDGTVELEAQGERAEVDAFLKRLRGAMSGYVRREELGPAPPVEGETGFGIRFF